MTTTKPAYETIRDAKGETWAYQAPVPSLGRGERIRLAPVAAVAVPAAQSTIDDMLSSLGVLRGCPVCGGHDASVCANPWHDADLDENRYGTAADYAEGRL